MHTFLLNHQGTKEISSWEIFEIGRLVNVIMFVCLSVYYHHHHRNYHPVTSIESMSHDHICQSVCWFPVRLNVTCSMSIDKVINTRSLCNWYKNHQSVCVHLRVQFSIWYLKHKYLSWTISIKEHPHYPTKCFWKTNYLIYICSSFC